MMNIKVVTCLRLLLSLVIVVGIGLSFPAPPVEAGLFEWTTVDTPDTKDNVIVSPSEVNAIAIGPDGLTFYATDIPNSKCYRSFDGGVKWTDISTNLTGNGATLPVWDIVVAPDNPTIVVAVTSSGGLPRSVFVSTDAGNTWQDTGFSVAANIGALDISQNYGAYAIAVGTRTGAGGGNVYMFAIPGFDSWEDQSFTGDIIDIKFSTTYASDSSLVVLSSDATGSFVVVGINDISANTTTWNTSGKVEITTGGAGTSPTAAQILTGDLELPFDFSGQNPAQRHMYVSTNDDNASGNAGIYRIDDDIIYNLTPPTTNMISGIAFIGLNSTGKLLAAEVPADASQAKVETWFSPNPGATCPQATCILWEKTDKPPTGGGNSGNGNSVVAWSPDGTSAYCGTSSANLDIAGWPNGYLTGQALDESAFSVTRNNGDTWNQQALIDTEITFLADVVATANAQTLYLATINTNAGLTGFDSVWRSIGMPGGTRIWERVFCVITPTDDAILRIGSPETTQPLFFAARSSNDLFVTLDRGDNWSAALPGVNISDLAVTRIDGTLTTFILDNASVRSGEYNNFSWKWNNPIGTGLTAGHMITAISSGIVLVGESGGGGRVAYSRDAGQQWEQTHSIPAGGNIHPIVDTRYPNNIFLYAGSDDPSGGLYFWLVGPGLRWTPMEPPGTSFFGIAQMGTLYGAWSSGGTSAVARTLYPELMAPPFVEWDTMQANLPAGVVFTREPNSLKAAEPGILWAIDNRPYTATTGRLWGYLDAYSPGTGSFPSLEQMFAAPIVIAPAPDHVALIDPTSGDINDIEFEWRQMTIPKDYEIWIAEDVSFDTRVIEETITVADRENPSWILEPKSFDLEAGKTFYWKVRVVRTATDERGTGDWSDTRSFSTETRPSEEKPNPNPTPTPLMPRNGDLDMSRTPAFSWTPAAEASEYELIIASNESLTQVVVRPMVSGTTYIPETELDWNTTYFWQVNVASPYVSEPGPVFSFTVMEEIITGPECGTAAPTILPWIIIAVVIVAFGTFMIVRRARPGLFRPGSRKDT